MKRIFKFLLFINLSAIFLLSSFVLYMFIITSSSKLDEEKLITSNSNITFLDDLNEEIEVSAIKNNVNFISLDKLNTHTINAFISIEDKRFFEHNGFDFKRIIASLINNIKTASFKEGGSTISQQLIKNTHLNSEKTLKRKFKEFRITYQLEKKYSKEEILQAYLNTIYFGKGAYGINNASMVYFNKTADKLTLNESCVLASIIKAPKIYSPFNNMENAFNRKNLVLKLMFENNYITKEEYLKAKNEEIELNNKNTIFYSSDYIKAVQNELENIFVLNPYKLKGNVKVYTYLDNNLQKQLSEINVENCENYNKSQIVINSKKGGIIAYFGSNSNLKRTPASCVKPWLIYAPMINDNKLLESSIISDSPIDINGYKPQNYLNKYYGKVDVKTALSKSLNVPAVKLLNAYGLKNANKYAKKLAPNFVCKDLTSALGNCESGLTLKELCDAYSPFNNDGNFKKSSFIKRIEVNGKVVYQNKNEESSVFSKETSFIINDILKETVKTGTLKKLKDFNFDLCGKTGTNGNSNGNTDAYSICYTSEHTIGSWIGEGDTLLPNSVSGGTYPAIYVNEILKNLYNNHLPENFKKPQNVIELNIDIDELYNNEKAYVSNNDNNYKTYFYISGTEPKIRLENSKTPIIENAKISQLNGKVKIEFSLKNAIKYEIIRNNKIVYVGEIPQEFYENLIDYGYYDYSIIAYSQNGKTIKYDLPKIKFDKSSLNIFNDWDNDF